MHADIRIVLDVAAGVIAGHCGLSFIRSFAAGLAAMPRVTFTVCRTLQEFEALERLRQERDRHHG